MDCQGRPDHRGLSEGLRTQRTVREPRSMRTVGGDLITEDCQRSPITVDCPGSPDHRELSGEP